MHPRDTRRAGGAFLLGSVFFAFAFAFTLRVSPGVMVDDLMRDFRVGIALGWWSDRVGRRRLPMTCGAALSVAAQAALIFIPGLPVAALGVLSFLAGVGGSSLVLGFAVGREHNPPTRVGLTIGVINTATTGSGALFQPLIGWLLDLRWSGATEAGVRIYEAADYRFALGVLPLAGLFGLALVFFLRETWSRKTIDR